MSLLAINRYSGEAVYSQIAHRLQDEIQKSHTAGNYLPAEHVLAERFNVNRHTVRRAVDELIQCGLVERIHGKGTRVLDAPVDYTLGQVTRFTEQMEAGGSAATKILRKLVIPARGGVAQRLAVQEETPVIWFETLRSVDEHPYCLISHFLPLARFPELMNQFSSGSLHALINQCYQVQLRRVESLVTAILPQGDDASLLNMSQHQPVLRVKSINIDTKNNNPCEYALTRFRADRIQLRINP